MAMPLVTGLALGRPGAAAWLFASAAVLAFLLHEPGLVLLGARGVRARSEDGPLAGRLVLALGPPALAAGAAATLLAPVPARLSLLAVAALAAAAVWLARRRLEMTRGGSAVVGAAMASALLPVALSAGAGGRASFAAFAAWTLSFAIAAAAVDAVMARGRPGTPDPGRRNAAGALLLWGLAAALAGMFALPWELPLSLVPTAMFAMGACLSRTGPGRLRELGWALVGSTAVTLIVLVHGLRRG
jgi:hypothetical protein